MQRLRLLLALFLSTALLACAAPAPGGPDDPEVVVYGGTSGGIACAVQLARHGRSVVLLEPTHRVGGLSTSGLGATDIGNKAAVGGISREFYQRLRTHYGDDAAWVQEAAADFKGRGHRPNEDAAWTFEPKAALQVFEEMLTEAGVPVVHGARLDLGAGGVTVEDGRIVAIRTVDGRIYRARCFVDATYEGDLLAKAGVSYRVGREANAEHGETLDGVQVQNATKHQFTHDIDPYVVPGDPSSGLLRYVAADGPGEEGDADHRVQAYCFRLCTTDAPDNRLPWPKPPGYDEKDFELLLRNFDAGDRRVPWHPVLMPNRKTDTNNNFAISTDAIGLSYGWPEADWDERARIFADHLYYTQGLLWTLANHPRVPADVQKDFHKWGLARDEFVETGNWPPQLYVREARRMVSDVVLAEKHCRGLEVVDDPVGLGAYGMDSHNVQRYVDAQGRVRNEGDVQVHGFTPYGISYRSIVPRRGECTNLLVPVCLSSTHIAFGSARMEPVFMVLGHSAATAAHLALAGNGVVQDVRYDELRKELLAADQTLAWVGEKKPLPTGLDPAKLTGSVVDDRAARFTGSWQQSDSVKPFVGAGYSHDGEAAPGTAKATFEIFVLQPGKYSAQLAWQPHPNRAVGKASVRHGSTSVDADVDQRRTPPIDGLWLEVTQLSVSMEEPVIIELERVSPEGFLVIDAARLVRIEEK
ncbi:MAG: FAD-dependent oxidoreductase [Planctomycetota bacterium]|nr:FAD-dependent oxidoreductase [Planctomycetota bacterium]